MDAWKQKQEFVAPAFAPQCNFKIEEAIRNLLFLSKLPSFSELPHSDHIDPSINGIADDLDVEKRSILKKLLGRDDDLEVMTRECTDHIDGEIHISSFLRLQSGWGLGLTRKKEAILSETGPTSLHIIIVVSFVILLVGTIGGLITQMIGSRWTASEKALKKQTYNLGERVKELNCLYKLSEIFESYRKPSDFNFRRIVEIIPSAWQYPAVTGARIVLDDK